MPGGGAQTPCICVPEHFTQGSFGETEELEVLSTSSSVFVQTEEESHPGSVCFSLLALKEVLKPQKVC